MVESRVVKRAEWKVDLMAFSMVEKKEVLKVLLLVAVLAVMMAESAKMMVETTAELKVYLKAA